ncbi:ribonuclease P protein component 1 [Candidatus Thorarchaeota archaeon]|jgi:ribonuclease P protein subunit POP4|nr:MAG: ribonuclease P protein component 1 [Candidatus Thorarchaeota archaeon]
MITPENLVQHELIGLQLHVVASTDPSCICRSGTVLDESRNMLHIQTPKNLIRVAKSNSVFDIELPNETIVRVAGRLLEGRPEQRLKKPLHRRW